MMAQVNERMWSSNRASAQGPNRVDALVGEDIEQDPHFSIFISGHMANPVRQLPNSLSRC